MIESIASAQAHRAFSVQGVYTPPAGDAVPVRVIIDLQIDAMDEFGRLISKIDVAYFLLSEVQPVRGGTLSAQGYSGLWDVMDRHEDDGIIRTMRLSKRP